MKEIVGHDKRIHEQIEAAHVIYPKDWHDGNINALNDILSKLEAMK
mgnify:CR=1 FL=1